MRGQEGENHLYWVTPCVVVEGTRHSSLAPGAIILWLWPLALGLSVFAFLVPMIRGFELWYVWVPTLAGPAIASIAVTLGLTAAARKLSAPLALGVFLLLLSQALALWSWYAFRSIQTCGGGYTGPCTTPAMLYLYGVGALVGGAIFTVVGLRRLSHALIGSTPAT